MPLLKASVGSGIFKSVFHLMDLMDLMDGRSYGWDETKRRPKKGQTMKGLASKWALLLSLLCGLVLQGADSASVSGNVDLGFLIDYTWTEQLDMISHAKMAIKHLNDHNDGWWDDIAISGVTFNLKLKGSNCSTTDGINSALELTQTDKVKFVIGPTCSKAGTIVGLVGSIFEVPILSYSATSPELSNKGIYQYFSRNVPSDQYQGRAMADIANHYGWKRFAIMNADDPYGRGVASVMVTYSLNKYNISSSNIMELIIGSDSASIANQIQFLQTENMNILFVVTSNSTEFTMILKEVNDLGLVGRGFQIVSSDGMVNNAFLLRAEYSAVRNSGLGMFGVAFKQNSSLTESYITEWKKASATEYPSIYNDRSEIAVYGLSTYDSVISIARAIHSLNSKGKDLTNGTANLEEVRKTNFLGTTGTIALDSNGDLIGGRYSIKNVQWSNGKHHWVNVGQWEDNSLDLYNMPIVYQSQDKVNPVVDGLCIDDCSRHGVCDQRTSQCSCYHGYTGTSCNTITPLTFFPFTSYAGNAICNEYVYYHVKAYMPNAVYTIRLKTGVNPVTNDHDAIAMLSQGNYISPALINSTAHTVQLSSEDPTLQELIIRTNVSTGDYYVNVFGNGTACPASFIISLDRNSHIDSLSECKKKYSQGYLIYEDFSVAWGTNKGGTVYVYVFAFVFSILAGGTACVSLCRARKVESAAATRLLSNLGVDKILLVKRNAPHFVFFAFCIIQYLQMLFLAVGAQSDFDGLENYRTVLGILSLSEMRYSLYIWVIYIVGFLYLLALGATRTHLRTYVLKNPKLRSMVFYIPIFLYFCTMIAIVPLTTNFTRSMVCTYTSAGDSFFTAEGLCDLKCWKGIHVVYVVFSTIFTFVLLPSMALTCYEWQEKFTDFQIFFKPYYFVVVFLLRVALSILRVIFFKESSFYSGFFFLICFWVIIWIHIASPCYVPWVNDAEKVFLTAASYSALLCFISSTTTSGTGLMWAMIILSGTIIITIIGAFIVSHLHDGFLIQTESFNKKISTLKAFFKGDLKKSSITSGLNSLASTSTIRDIKFKEMIVTALQADEDADSWLEIADVLNEWRAEVCLTLEDSIHLYHVVISKVYMLPYVLFVLKDKKAFFNTCALLIAMSKARSKVNELQETSESLARSCISIADSKPLEEKPESEPGIEIIDVTEPSPDEVQGTEGIIDDLGQNSTVENNVDAENAIAHTEDKTAALEGFDVEDIIAEIELGETEGQIQEPLNDGNDPFALARKMSSSKGTDTSVNIGKEEEAHNLPNAIEEESGT
eukprot:Nk52_evm8s369 gene=Nk52_evmTU8s369